MFVVLTTIIMLVSIFKTGPALAQGGDPPAVAAAQGLTIFTNYPAQEAAIGELVNFALTLRSDSTPQIANLEVKDLPQDWTASFRGGSRVIESAYVEPENDTKVDFKVEPPANVKAGTYKFSVVARGEKGETAVIPIELIVKEKLPPSLNFDVELPTLRGGPDTTFRYNATLKNSGDQDLTVNLLADTQPGFLVNFKLSGQDVTDIPVAANESKRLSVEVKTYPDMPAGSYPVHIMAQGGEAQTEANLTAEVTGQPDMSVAGPNGRLSAEAYVGDATPLQVVVQNSGTAAIHNVEMSATQPSGWQVDFEPKHIPEVAAGKQVEVTANIKPSDQAIAGDYVVTVKAKSEDGPTKSEDFRITVLTSTLWGIAGVGLIAVSVVVVGLAVMRFGRR
jgi:uncharacterized membrane protein